VVSTRRVGGAAVPQHAAAGATGTIQQGQSYLCPLKHTSVLVEGTCDVEVIAAK